MKTKTLIILFALVMALSVSAGVFAQDFTETWDEDTVLTVFSDLGILFPDLFADIDGDFLFVDDDEPVVESFTEKAVSLADVEGYEAKAPIDTTNFTVKKATFDACGDGLVAFEIEIEKAAKGTEGSYKSGYYGPDNITYIRSLVAKIGTTEYPISKCTSTGGDKCRSVRFQKNKATIKGYIEYDGVLTDSDTISFNVELVHSTYKTAFWQVEKEDPIVIPVTASFGTRSKNYCQAFLQEYNPIDPSKTSMKAVYDENTGEARFQVTIRNYKSTNKSNYVIPADVMIDGYTKRYTDYTCKYTIYNNANGAPRTDYCKFGEGIALGKNALIRFDITIDALSAGVLRDLGGQDLPFTFRVGGMLAKIPGVFTPTPYPCPVTTRMSVMDPLHPFMTFYGVNNPDSAIKPSGPYGVYEGGVWGLYQKCGKYAYMAVRLQNDGIKDETIDLKNVAVAINGGTPMSWHWVLSTVEPYDNKIDLSGGDWVTLIGRAKVTDIPSQLNSDAAMTGAVNFLDYGFYITGKVYSDHNNTNCVAP